MENKLIWDLQVNASAVSVQLIWIKGGELIAKIGEVTPKKKYLSPSTRKRNAQRINQWKAKRNEAVGDTKVNAQAQAGNSNSQIEEQHKLTSNTVTIKSSTNHLQ